MSAPLGMDHGLYDFSPMPGRPALTWPGGAGLAVSVFLYFEHWHTHPSPDAVNEPRFQDPFGRFEPDYRAFSIRQYGLRVGIFRILDALDAHGLKVTVAANAEAAEHYPYLVEQFARRGYEFAGHGLNASQMISSRMSEADEREYIAASLDRLERMTGQRPLGWISQDYGESQRTPDLLAQAGMTYVADWANDDQPYLMKTSPGLVSIPNQADLDDLQLLWHRRIASERYPEIMQAAALQLAEEGRDSGRFLGLHIHPWLLGMPHRIRYLESALSGIAGQGGCWFATASEVAQAAARQLAP
jgi:allantoinase